MTVKEFTDHAGQSAIGWVVVAVLLFCVGLVRRIFTNQQTIRDNQAKNETSIRLLRVEIQGRENLRLQDRQHLTEKIDALKVSVERLQGN